MGEVIDLQHGRGSAFDWCAKSRALDGQGVSGDGFRLVEDGRTCVVAVIDGLGHGPEANDAATAIGAAIRADAAGPAEIVERCHRAAQRTRGAAVAVAWVRVEEGILSLVGVGNVEVVVHRRGGASLRFVQQAGVVGYRLPRLRARTVQMGAGDWLLMATDGIAPDFAGSAAMYLAGSDAPGVVGPLFDRHARATDDALLWGGRFAPGGPS